MARFATPQSVKLVKAHLSDMVPALKVSWNCSVRIGDLGTEKVLPEIMVTAVPDDSIAFRKRSAPTLLRLLMSLGSPPIAQISDLGPSLGLIGVLQMGLAISILHAYEFSVLDGISFDTVAKCYDELIRRIMKCYKEDSIGRRAVSVEDYHAWFYCAESIHHVFTPYCGRKKMPQRSGMLIAWWRRPHGWPAKAQGRRRSASTTAFEGIPLFIRCAPISDETAFAL